MAERVFVALGSNVGDRARNLFEACRMMAALPRTVLVAASTVEDTAPIGPVAQGRFLNQMVLLETDLSPQDFLAHLLDIERVMGRERGERWGPRTMDLDIVRFGDRMVNEPGLTIPHPELPHRDFWRRELAELRPHGR